MRLIDAEALIQEWYRVNNIDEDDRGARFIGYTEIPRFIANAPTVEVDGDLISRADAIEAVMAEGRKVYTSEYANAERIIYEADAVEALSMLPSAEAVQGWIPFKTRPLTDEEKQEYPDWTYTFDCPLPDDGEEILLSNGKYVWMDTFINDGECYLDGGDDIDDGMAWMHLPEPYKGGEDE